MRNYYRDAICASELVVDFNLNEGAGTTVYSRAPVVANMVLTNQGGAGAPAWVVETVGMTSFPTLDFTAASNHSVDSGAIAAGVWDRFAATDAITIETVVYMDVLPVTASFILAGYVSVVAASGAAFPQLGIDSSGYIDFRPCRDAAVAGGYVHGSVDLSGAYYHIVASYSDSDDLAEVLVNGGSVEDLSDTMTGTTDIYDPTGEEIYFGHRYDHPNFGVGAYQHFLDGHIVYVRAWGRRLTRRNRLALFERARGIYGL